MTLFPTNRHALRVFWLSITGLLLSACQQPWSALVKDPAYRVEIVQGSVFRHRVISRLAGKGGVLDVYIEGDGRPWTTPTQVALDPTPGKLLMLDLMRSDPHPAIYLGRPCYLEVADPRCHFVWWTHRRYAPEVVASLNTALDEYAREYAAVRLIGHSGGGTLAMLMAAGRQDVDTVVTLAGNLDIDRWADLHGYSRLEGSLNPVDTPLPRSIRQHHYVGRLDRMVPPQLVTDSAAVHGNVEVTVLEQVDHNCCWRTHWPEVLEQLEAGKQIER